MKDDSLGITERSNLNIAEAIYQTLTENLNQCIFLKDRNYRFISVNKSFSDLLGLNPDNIIGKTEHDIFCEETAEKISEIDRKVFESGEKVCLTDECQTKNGKKIWFEIIKAPIRNSEGQIIHLLGILSDVTVQKQALGGPKESEEKYRLIFENAREGISIYEELFEQGRRLLECNPQYCEMSGYSREELMQISNTMEIQIEREGLQENIKRIEKIDSCQPYTGLFSWVRPDGKENYIEYTAVPLDVEGRRLTIGIDHDITERLHAESELKRTLSLLQSAIESIADGILVVDTEGRIVLFNERFANIFHLPAEVLKNSDGDYVLRNVLDQLKDPENLIKNIKELKSKPNAENTDILEFRDGRIFECYSIPQIMDGRTVGRVWNFRDITEQKLAENALRESEEKYRLLIENANEAIIVVQDMKLKFVNPKSLQILNYSEEELTSRDFVGFIHPEDRNMVLERHIQRLGGGNPPQTYPFRVVGKNGNPIWVEITVVPIAWAGKPAVLCFLRDITEKRKIEKELLKIQKLESIGILAGGIAHDFNNILTGILGNISLAMMFINPNDKAYNRLQEAEKASLRAKNLTQQLLTFAKGGEPILKVTPIADLLRESALFALSGSNVRCEFSIPDSLWNVEIDEGQINQVINNLTINAVQAMPNGGIIKIYAENVVLGEGNTLPLKSGEYVKISIEDQGVGITEENLTKIFDPFFSTKQKGSGLGLAIAFSIIKKHHGHIEVKSQIGVGTVFYIYLPIAPKNAEHVNK